MVRACKVCCELKPLYAQTDPSHLSKATQPFERLSLDFKGLLPSTNQFKYLLVGLVCDEYSRFTFVFPCKNVDAQCVISNLCALFPVFGMPSYVHSDRGSSFMSSELKIFCTQKELRQVAQLGTILLAMGRSSVSTIRYGKRLC